jgi:hypothetical protein
LKVSQRSITTGLRLSIPTMARGIKILALASKGLMESSMHVPCARSALSNH